MHRSQSSIFSLKISENFADFLTTFCKCRMSNVVRKRLEPCQKSLQRLSDIALCARKGKRKMKGNQIWEKISAHTENSPCTYWFSRKRALCVTCKKADPTETNVSRANRAKQDSQLNNVVKGDRSGNVCTELIQANKKVVSLSHQIQMRPRSKPSRGSLRSWRPTPYPNR